MVTILINAIMFGGLYLGWKLEAYPTSYFLIGAGAIAVLDVILILYKLYRANKKIAELKAKITPTIKLDYDEAEGCLEVIPVYVKSPSKGFEARTKYNVRWLRIKATNEIESACDWLQASLGSDPAQGRRWLMEADEFSGDALLALDDGGGRDRPGPHHNWGRHQEAFLALSVLSIFQTDPNATGMAISVRCGLF